MHRQENLNSSIRFTSSNIPFNDDGQSSRGGAQTAGFETVDEDPQAVVVAEAGGEVDGEVEGGERVGVVAVLVEDGEEFEGFGCVVPEAFQCGVDEGFGPLL